ncbi:hypothetical protein Vi05172_g11341 [Venturia inaequalis]|uniref:Pyridoxamine 5'-phosphate oxidase putative domain-containing protein n=1 Tax=Venturia inaequalis TaxID=5025 RepID=A0A8H3ZJH6_VENIN|nr:hypothetical protein EG327_000873 [Venturia inaequalis]RDI78711.1 hypothetical protein Vi05172_g11341 [Venturia inaequalis]
MGVFYETIPPSLQEWCLDQKMFWVATAPLSGDGHVNVSPKGGPYFGIPDEKTFWYIDLTGSGNETISHLWERGNGRITIQFNAFEGPPRIVRFWGKGRVLENGTSDFDTFVGKHSIDCIPGTRSIIIVDIHQVGSSCGYSVPFYEFKKHRPVLNNHWANKEKKFKAGKTEESMDRYWASNNARSLDGLPGMKRALTAAKIEGVAPVKKMIGPFSPEQMRRLRAKSYTLEHIFLVALAFFMLGIGAVLYGEMVAEKLIVAFPVLRRTDTIPLLRHVL